MNKNTEAIMYRVSLFLILFFTGGALSAQELTLQQCIDTALARNLEVQRSGLAVQTAEAQWRMAAGARLPNLSADLYQGFSQGRGIDPTSNSFVNQSLNFSNYQLNSNVVLFNGGALRNTQLQQSTAYEAARLEVQQVKDYLTIGVITDYLQVLINEDLVRALQQQAELSRAQYERLLILDRQGAIRPSELSDMKGQWMNDQLNVSNARNALELARLALAQRMNLPYSPALTVARLDTALFSTVYSVTAAQVLDESQRHFAAFRAAGLRSESARYGLLSARGARMPLLTIGGGLATAYSSAARDASGKVAYNSQLKNNFSTNIGLGLSVPLFNRLQSRGRMRLAEVEWKRSQLQEAQVSQQVRQQIETAWLNLQNARQRLDLLQEQAAAYTASYTAAEVRYKAGVGSVVDYLIAKDRMDRAQINLIMARYDFVLRQKVLDYFRSSGS
jgi:outer membrane protein